MAETRLIPDPGPSSGPPRRRWPWLAALLGFLVGAVLSGVVTGLVVAAQTEPDRVVTTFPVPAPTTTAPSGSATAAAQPCLEAADLAQQAMNKASDGLRQLSRLDSTSLQQTIDELQALRPRLDAASTECRQKVERA